MSEHGKVLELRSSPHIVRGINTDTIMRNVVLALLPAAAFAVYAFGLAAALILAVTTGTAVLTEHLLTRLSGRESTISDWSAAITGLLLGLTLPPNLPLWMAVMGSAVAIGLGKFIFGGLGFNAFNPALVGRAFLQAAFPVTLTTFAPAFSAERFAALPAAIFSFPFARSAADAVTSATPLGAMKFQQQITATYDLVMGLTSGSIGETSSLAILLGGLYLAARKMLNWRIPLAVFLAVAVLSGFLHWLNPVTYPGAEFMLFSGGLMLGAVFMATDMVASPVTTRGVIIYGILIGVLIVIIRVWGGLPEGVMYSILFANAISPLIDRTIQPVVYGTKLQGAAK